jgi:hypothetical protein
MKILLTRHLLLAALLVLLASAASLGQTNTYIRINQGVVAGTTRAIS